MILPCWYTKERCALKHKEPAGRSGYYPHGHYAGSPNRRQKRPVRKPLFYGLIAVCAVIFVTSATLLIRYYSDIAASRSASAQLNQLYQSAQDSAFTPATAPSAVPTAVPSAAPSATPASTLPAETVSTAAPQPAAITLSASGAAGDLSVEELWPTTYPDNPRLDVSSVFDELQERNRDIIAWLKIDDELEEPVVQRDNVFYLTHNALQQESVTGALFLDENCDLIHVPTQMVIHGHNMKEGAMFGMLKKYKVKGAAFYREHAFIDFNTLYENGRYVIFAVAEVDIRAGQPYYLPFWHYSRFDSVEAFNNYIETARACSLYHCTVDVQPGDRLLTLSTCTGTDDNLRLVVIARKLREGENQLDLNMEVMSTYDR